MKHIKYKNLHQFISHPYLFPVNSYVYETKESLIVIDIGSKAFVKVIVALSKQLHKEVTHVILTHPHKDHISGVDCILKQFENIKLAISTRDAKLLDGNFTFEKDESMYQIKGGFLKIKNKPTILLEDGDTIETLQIISSPGHTPGSISLYDKKQGILIVGDAMQTRAGVSVAGDTRLLFPFVSLATGSKDKALASVQRLAQLDIRLLACGHGKMIEEANKQVDEAIKRAKRRNKHG